MITLELELGNENDDIVSKLETFQYSVVRRNDSRWGGTHLMMERLLRLKDPMNTFFNTQTKYSNKALSHHDYLVCREATSVLDPFMECTKLIQGGKFGYSAPTLALLKEIHDYCSGDLFEMRDVIYSNTEKIDSKKENLVPCIRLMV